MAKWLKENSTLADKELWVSQLKTTKLMLIGLFTMNTNLWMVLLSHGRPPESCTGSYETGSWFEPHGGRTALWCTPPVSFLSETCQKDQTGWRSARNFYDWHVSMFHLRWNVIEGKCVTVEWKMQLRWCYLHKGV